MEVRYRNLLIMQMMHTIQRCIYSTLESPNDCQVFVPNPAKQPTSRMHAPLNHERLCAYRIRIRICIGLPREKDLKYGEMIWQDVD